MQARLTTQEGGRPTAASPGMSVKSLTASGVLHLVILVAFVCFWFSPPVEPLPQPNLGFSVQLVEFGPGRALSNPIAPPHEHYDVSSTSPPVRVLSRPLLKLPATFASTSMALADPVPKAAKPLIVKTANGITPDPAKAKTDASSAEANLQSQLQALAQQQQSQAQAGQQNSAQVVEGGQPSYSVAVYRAKDFIRAQIERHWYLDRRAAGAGDFSVALHLELQSDGRVLSAEIIRDSNLAGSEAYRSAASSLRGAALLSSPLVIPEGQYEALKDIELTFRPKDALQ